MQVEYFIKNPDNVDLRDPSEEYHTEVLSAEVINGVLTITLKVLPLED